MGRIEPPFNFNSPLVASYPPEESGKALLDSMCENLGWPSLAGKRLLDFGCGVRFAQTIVNLGLEIGAYTGVDVNAEAIQWLRQNVTDQRLLFLHLNMKNQLYSPEGGSLVPGTLARLGLKDFDAACMFSVITHQKPGDAALIFSELAGCVRPGGQLYFTGLINDAVAEYEEQDEQPCVMSAYNPKFLSGLARDAGWIVERIIPRAKFHQPAFICRKRD